MPKTMIGIIEEGKVVSDERVELVFFCGIINGSLGLSNKFGQGWMTAILLLEVVKHIKII